MLSLRHELLGTVCENRFSVVVVTASPVLSYLPKQPAPYNAAGILFFQIPNISLV